jgi:hypothetical protein
VNDPNRPDHAAPEPEPPATAAADAQNRALRTLAQGLLTDVLLAAALVLGSALVDPGFAWSRAYWSALGLSIAKTVLMSICSYVMRRVVPPPTQ